MPARAEGYPFVAVPAELDAEGAYMVCYKQYLHRQSDAVREPRLAIPLLGLPWLPPRPSGARLGRSAARR